MLKPLTITALAALAAGAMAQTIKVEVDGERVKFPKGVEPIIQNRRVLVPLRGVMEKIGAEVTYDADRLRVIVRKNNMEVELWMGSRHATVNGEEKLFDTAMAMHNGRVLVPVRFLAETLEGASVGWDSRSRTVRIKMRK